MNDKILSRSEVVKIVGFSARTMYYEIAAGRFPRQVQLSKRRVGWKQSDLQAWFESREGGGGYCDHAVILDKVENKPTGPLRSGSS